MTLTEFLLARIAEDEAVARQGDPWVGADDPTSEAEDRWQRQPHGANCAWRMGDFGEKCVCAYPARVLVGCEAKRRIVDRAANDYDEEWHSGYTCGAERGYGAILRILALPYTDHPDYDEAWRI